MSSWQDLIQVAMLGTDRQPLPKLAEDDPAQELVSSSSESVEKQLLDRIAIQAYRRRAGAIPAVRLGESGAAAPPDTLPMCNPEAAQTLGRFMIGSKTWLVREWLELAMKAGVRPPDERLPELLGAGRRIKSIRHLIYESLGERGLWLAAQRPEWLYATLDINDPASISRLMATGKTLEQQFVLERVRSLNPEYGRQLIEANWSSATARMRTLMLDLMIPELTMADEPFLEGLLESGLISVRRRVVDLLSRLPESRLCARMNQRAETYLRWEPGDGSRSTYIELDMSSGITPELIRDGLVQTRGREGFTQMGWRLLHFVRSTPLSTWTELFAHSIEEIIAAGLASEWDRPLIRGWSVAAQRQNNKVWAEALLFGCSGIVDGRYGVSSLLGTLAPDKQEQFVLELLETPNSLPEFQRYSAEAAVLRECKHSWSDPFARQMIRHFKKLIRTDQTSVQPQLVLHRTLRQIANFFPPSLYDESRAELEPLGPTYKRWQASIQGFLRVLEIRTEMQAALME